VEFSTDPAESARQVLAEALELLQAHEMGTEDDDLKEDFTNYWNQSVDTGSPPLSIIYEDSMSIGSYLATSNELFAFSSKEAMFRWWNNRNGATLKQTNAAHFIKLKTFPLPSEFPDDAEDFLKLLESHAVDAGEAILKALSQIPNGAVFVLVAVAPSGSAQFAGGRLLRTQPAQKKGFRSKKALKLRPGASVRVSDLLTHYTFQRLRTSRLDNSASRSVIDPTSLSEKRVILVGCGAIGAGVARLLAKAGIGRLDLVDPETLGWENIRRHELGARRVRQSKAAALASDLRQDLPEIVEIRAFPQTIQELVLSGNKLMEGADLIVATTGSLHTDNYVDGFSREGARPIPVVFGWMVAWGVAGHALLLSGESAQFIDGFEDGTPRRPSSRNDRQPPKECGNSTTPFGAVEVTAVQAMIVEICIDRLLQPTMGDTWRTWWASDRNLVRTGGRWTEEFLALKPPALVSGVMEREWP
jgi:ThiF family